MGLAGVHHLAGGHHYLFPRITTIECHSIDSTANLSFFKPTGRHKSKDAEYIRSAIPSPLNNFKTTPSFNQRETELFDD